MNENLRTALIIGSIIIGFILFFSVIPYLYIWGQGYSFSGMLPGIWGPCIISFIFILPLPLPILWVVVLGLIIWVVVVFVRRRRNSGNTSRSAESAIEKPKGMSTWDEISKDESDEKC
ncbi:hypothetical protein ACFLWE_01165 [Chloroflexota bacterium]